MQVTFPFSFIIVSNPLYIVIYITFLFSFYNMFVTCYTHTRTRTHVETRKWEIENTPIFSDSQKKASVTRRSTGNSLNDSSSSSGGKRDVWDMVDLNRQVVLIKPPAQMETGPSQAVPWCRARWVQRRPTGKPPCLNETGPVLCGSLQAGPERSSR